MKVSFSDVECAFNDAECAFNVAECRFNVVERNFHLEMNTFIFRYENYYDEEQSSLILTEQNGLFLVGDGYTVKKVTIE